MTTRAVMYSVQLERLIRHVRRPDGRSYAHHCTLGVFEQVVGYLDDHPHQATHTQRVRRALELPSTQVHVAMEFLVERGLLVRCGRQVLPQCPYFYEEALEHFQGLGTTKRYCYARRTASDYQHHAVREQPTAQRRRCPGGGRLHPRVRLPAADRGR
jgi:hypothetical protein